MKAFPVRTPIGILRGKESIFIDSIQIIKKRIIISGEFNTSPNNTRDTSDKNIDFIPFILTFDDMIYFNSSEVSLFDTEIFNLYDSSFIILENSNLIQYLNSKDSSIHLDTYFHFIMREYEYAYDIVASDFSLTSNNKLTTHKLPFKSVIKQI